jgi:hypothetical protein
MAAGSGGSQPPQLSEARAVPITKLFAWGEGDTCRGHVLRETVGRRAEACTAVLLLLFITAVPNTKLCAWGEEEDSGGHVLWDTTSLGLCGLV